MRIGLSVLTSLVLMASPAVACQNDTECRGGRVCKDAQCVAPGCAADVDCPDPQVCEKGVCTHPAAAAPPRPQVYGEPETRGIKGLWLTGSIVLPVTYALTVTVTSILAEDSDKYVSLAAIPILGPWLILGEDSGGYDAPLAASGILQLAATTMIIVGVTVRREVPSRYGVDGSWTFRPTVTPGGGGGLLQRRAF